MICKDIATNCYFLVASADAMLSRLDFGGLVKSDKFDDFNSLILNLHDFDNAAIELQTDACFGYVPQFLQQ